MTFETFWVNLWQEVCADVPRDEARVGDYFTQERNVVGHTWCGGGQEIYTGSHMVKKKKKKTLQFI